MKETDIQAAMVKDAKTMNGFAFKMSNRFLIGVPDLFLQFEGLPTAIIEVKYLRRAPRDGIVRCDLTAHQARYISSINKRGGLSGWVCVVADKLGEFDVMVGRNTGKADVGGQIRDNRDTQSFWIRKQRGFAWPMRNIVDALLRLQR